MNKQTKSKKQIIKIIIIILTVKINMPRRVETKSKDWKQFNVPKGGESESSGNVINWGFINVINWGFIHISGDTRGEVRVSLRLHRSASNVLPQPHGCWTCPWMRPSTSVSTSDESDLQLQCIIAENFQWIVKIIPRSIQNVNNAKVNHLFDFCCFNNCVII